MTDIGWGNLAQYEHYGRVGDIEEDFDIISYEDSKGELYSSFKHASHAMLFARNDTVLWDLYKSRAAIMVSAIYLRIHLPVCLVLETINIMNMIKNQSKFL